MGQDVFKIDDSKSVKNNSIYINHPLDGSGITFQADHNPFDTSVVPSGTYDKMANWYDYEDQAYSTGT